MMGSQPNPKYQAMQMRQNYVNVWKSPLMNTLCDHPGYFCYALWCGQCASYGLRKQALYNDMTRYLCCNGACPCSGRMGEQKCPEFCLCMEAFLCFGTSVATTRWMIQDELQVQTTQCDNCIIGTMIFLQYLSCICQIAACLTGNNDIAAIAQIIDCAADLMWCSVCACMQTQHRIELNIRDANPGNIPPPMPAMQAPGMQMIPMGGHPQQQPYYPPPPGYPAQPQAYQGAPPGYPPPNYGPPPPGYNQGAYGPPGNYPPNAAPMHR